MLINSAYSSVTGGSNNFFIIDNIKLMTPEKSVIKLLKE